MYYVTVQVASAMAMMTILATHLDQELRRTCRSPQFGSLTPAIGLAAAQTQLHDPNRLDVVLQWAVSGVIDANYGISLRLHDASGKVWTSLDTQPGYGFQPTSAWQPGTLE